jgi:formate hydrogenlyase subunit 6/NADH:ubiquinone oxidoreductase subunit I
MSKVNSESDGYPTGRFPLQLPDWPPLPDGFRGLIDLDPALCIACGACAFVCPSLAIVVSETEQHFVWRYEAGQCAFSRRCVVLCPSQALRQVVRPLADITGAAGERKEYVVPYPNCPECGERTQPLSDIVLARSFPNINEEVREWGRLCARCRRKRTQHAVAETLFAKGVPPAGQ